MNKVVSVPLLVEQFPAETILNITILAGESVAITDDSSVLNKNICIVVGRDAQVTYNGFFEVAQGLVERVVTIECVEPGATAAVTIACHTQEAALFTLTTIQNHRAAHTTSGVRIVGVSENNSRVSVASTIYIAPMINAVTARQVHKQLLMDEGARAVSIPALDILSDDVACSHGSAITYLDPLQLFYLNARGYDAGQARKALISAFLH